MRIVRTFVINILEIIRRCSLCAFIQHIQKAESTLSKISAWKKNRTPSSTTKKEKGQFPFE